MMADRRERESYCDISTLSNYPLNFTVAREGELVDVYKIHCASKSLKRLDVAKNS